MATASVSPPSTSTAAQAPLFGTGALAILGSMLLLIAALTVVLIQTTRASSQATVEMPTPTSDSDPKDLARR